MGSSEVETSIDVPRLGCVFIEEAVLSSKLDRVFAFDPSRQVGEDKILYASLVAPSLAGAGT